MVSFELETDRRPTVDGRLTSLRTSLFRSRSYECMYMRMTRHCLPTNNKRPGTYHGAVTAGRYTTGILEPHSRAGAVRVPLSITTSEGRDHTGCCDDLANGVVI